MQNVDNRIEGLGATFLNMVLTISIITTMVTVLLNTNPKYSVIIVLVCAWLLLSSIIFLGSYFKSNKSIKEGNSLAMIIYIILTVLTLVALIYGIYTSDDTDKRIDSQEDREQNKPIWIKQ